MAERVGCLECGWRGNRVFKGCECHDICNCPAYGHCPKCGDRIRTMRIVYLYEEWRDTDAD